LTNSHLGHLKVRLSAPFACGSLIASSIRARHMAQRGISTVARGDVEGLSDGGIAAPGSDKAPMARTDQGRLVIRVWETPDAFAPHYTILFAAAYPPPIRK
jgi:hypothetical protein